MWDVGNGLIGLLACLLGRNTLPEMQRLQRPVLATGGVLLYAISDSIERRLEAPHARYESTSRRTVSIGMNSVSGSVGVGSKPKRA